MTESKGNKMLLAPILAGLMGAGLAMLFAPRSGKQTREKMQDRAKEVKQTTEDNLTSVRKSLDQSIQEAHDLKNRIAEAWRQTGHKAKDELEEIKDEQAMRRSPAQSSVLSTWEEEV